MIYRNIFFMKSEMGFTLPEIYSLIPSEVEIFEALWAIETKRKLEIMKKINKKRGK